MKSWITEFTSAAVLTAVSTIAYQYIQGGFENVSQGAFTALVVAIVPLAQRLIHKKRGG